MSDLLTLREIAEKRGLKHDTLRRYSSQIEGFPKPRESYPSKGGRLWSYIEVVEWFDSRPGRGKNRKNPSDAAKKGHAGRTPEARSESAQRGHLSRS